MDDSSHPKYGQGFLSGFGKLTLKLVPLALAAANLAHAIPMLPPAYVFTGGTASIVCSGPGCPTIVGPTSFNGTGAVVQTPAPANTISLSTTGSVTYTVVDTTVLPTLTLQWDGTVTPVFNDGISVPYTYSFDVSDSNNNTLLYTLVVSGALNDTSVANVTGPAGGTGLTVSGGSTALSSNLDGALRVALDIKFIGAVNVGDSFLVNVPAGPTIDIPLVSSLGPVPEPASIFLAAPALGALYLLRRRRRT